MFIEQLIQSIRSGGKAAEEAAMTLGLLIQREKVRYYHPGNEEEIMQILGDELTKRRLSQTELNTAVDELIRYIDETEKPDCGAVLALCRSCEERIVPHLIALFDRLVDDPSQEYVTSNALQGIWNIGIDSPYRDLAIVATRKASERGHGVAKEHAISCMTVHNKLFAEDNEVTDIVIANNSQQPQEDDAIFGGTSPSLEGAMVLSGFAGAKAKLNNPDLQVKIAALQQAIDHGKQGLDLALQFLNDESVEVQCKAYYLLNEIAEPRIQQALREFNPEGLKLEVIEVVTVNSYGEILQRQQRIARYLIEDLGDGTALEMAKIPGGIFIMGSLPGEPGIMDDELPQHEVTVEPFFMGKYQITQAQWQAVTSFPKVKIDLEPDPSEFKGANRPVEGVLWDEVVEFCHRLSQSTGKNYRLPSEAEWEYACRAGTTTPFHFGEIITTDLANFDGNYTYGDDSIYTYGDGVKRIYREETTEVGSFGVANNFGLYDMHGNVWEWCQDTRHKNYMYAPIDSSAWINEDDNIFRVLRGASWSEDPVGCRSANRYWYSFDSRSNEIGFRVVRE